MWLRWLFWRHRVIPMDQMEAPQLVPEPPLGSRELVESLGLQMEDLRRRRSEAMEAYQQTLKGNR